jgi:glucokinase
VTGSDTSGVRVGIDLGGTGTRAVAVADGQLVASVDAPTAELGAGPVPERMDRLAALVHRVVPHDARLLGVGVGASGPVDVGSGTIRNLDTLPWFSGFAFARELSERVGVAVAVDNDAVAAALGEHRYGAGCNGDRLLVVTLGTGVGCAVLVDGQPVRGADGAHPEGGHIPVDGDPQRCYCGLTGCWEQAASRAWLQRTLADVLGCGSPTRDTLAEAVAAAPGDPQVQQVFTRYGRAVGRGLATLHTLFQPRVTVLGGSASVCLPLFAEGMQEALYRAPGYDVPTLVRGAVLGDNAGAVGAATGLLDLTL